MSPAETDLTPGVFLPWDTAFFGFRIGRAHPHRLTPESLPALLHWSEAEKLRCLYLSAMPTCVSTLILAQEGGFRFVDMRLDLAITLSGTSLAPAAFRAVQAGELPRLESISRTSHTDTRFFKDPGFPAERVAELYAEWIRRDYRQHKVFTVNGVRSPVAGYVTCQVDTVTLTGRIGLIAVAEEEKGRGCGRSLVQGALHWFQSVGCREVLVATQASNVAAQRLYQSAGFRTAESSATFHRWF